MVEPSAQKTKYDYLKNSNQVIQGETKHRYRNEDTGEAASLRGKNLKFGDKVIHEKLPPSIQEKTKTAEIKKKTVQSSFGPSQKSSILSANIGNEIIYKPKTRETKIVYDHIYSTIQEKIGDFPPEYIRGASDEVIAMLKVENLTDKKRREEIEAITGKLDDETFNKFIVWAKQLVDYVIDLQGSENQATFELPVHLIEEGEKAHVEYTQEIQEEHNVNENEEENKNEHVGMKDEISNDQEDSNKVKISDINAFWLQRELSNNGIDDTQLLAYEKNILDIFEEQDLRKCENALVKLLNYEKFDFVKKLLLNRFEIYYLTKIGQTQSEEEKMQIMNKMNDTAEGSEIFKRISSLHEGNKSMKDWKTNPEAHAQSMEEDESNKHELTQSSTQQIKTLNLLDLVNIKESKEKKFKNYLLPTEAKMIQKAGYEEILIPSKKRGKNSEHDHLVKISDLPNWAQDAFPDSIKTLNPIQSKVFKSVFEDTQNLLICAPTGSGKTNIALLAILHEIALNMTSEKVIKKNDFKVIYIAPMKALVSEIVGNFRQRLSKYDIKVNELTGDSHLKKSEIDQTQIIVTTPEKWDVITRKSNERFFISLVKLIIIDEIHLLHDMRGPVLEALIARTFRLIESTREFMRIVALSATLPNFTDVAALLRVDPKNGLFFFGNEYRPVPLEQVFIGITEKKHVKKMLKMNELLYEKVIERAGRNQMLVFVHSRKETARTARTIREMALSKDELPRFLKDFSKSRDILQSEVDKVNNQDLKELLPFGIGIHHAGLSKDDRFLVESLFAAGHIQLLVSTATLAWGVNLPAHTVIIKGTQVYSPEKGSWIELTHQDVLQMMGRAGRPFYDVQGEGILITTSEELHYYLTLFNNQLPIESQFYSQLADHLNAEIVLGTICNVEDGISWLGYTYLFIRMLKNPTLYGISEKDIEMDNQLMEFRRQLIHSAAELLEKANLIKYERKSGNFQVTVLGKIAAQYYIKYDSMEAYNENLSPMMGLIDILKVFSLSKEFQYIPLREEEKSEIIKLADILPIPVKGSLEDPTSKVIILLQAYISKFKIEGFSINADMVYISQSANRITRALFEIALRRGWAQVADVCLKLCKMIERKMWNVSCPLRQFKGLPNDVLKSLEKKEQFTWDHYCDMTAQQLGELIKYPKLGATIYKHIHQIPKLELAAYIQPITRSTLQIELTITPKFDWDRKIHGNAEPFWIIVEDCDSEIVLHFEYLIIKEKYAEVERTISFIVSLYEPMPPQYFIKIISDRWINSEAVLPISFRHLLIPDMFPSPTELLDLQPLPVSTLKPEYSILFQNFEFFNTIQTQVFESVFNKDSNMLLCAPSGSGKSVIVDLAILRMIDYKDQGKWIYICGVNQVVNNTLKKFKSSFGKHFGVKVCQLTGNLTTDLALLENNQLIISNPENWDSISRRWRQRKQVQQTSLFIVDEIQLLSQYGSSLEVILSRMRYMPSQIEKNIRIIVLGICIADYKDVGNWIGAENVFGFQTTSRPLPLDLHIQTFDHNQRSARLFAMIKPMYKEIRNLEDDEQIFVIVSDNKRCKMTALEIMIQASNEGNASKFINNKMVIEEELFQDKALSDYINHGIGYISESQTQRDWEKVLELYQKKAIKILIISESMCWELEEVSCNHCIFYDAMKYDTNELRYVCYPIPDILHIMGKVGRFNSRRTAKVLLLIHTPIKEYLRKFITEPFPLESYLESNLNEHLNAEIANKTLQNKNNAIDWITWTFYYRRITKNPNYYNLQGISGDYINEHLSELIDNSLEKLEQMKCINIEEVNMTQANLGRISSYYYIKCETIHQFSQSLNGDSKMKRILDVLCSAIEFQDIPSKKHEIILLDKLSYFCKYPLEKDQEILQPSIKVYILLQCYFSRIKIPLEFSWDLKYILSKSFKLVNTIIDVLSSNGWLKSTMIAMEISQMMTQAIWSFDSPLLQLPYFDKEMVDKFSQINVKDVIDFLNMEDENTRKELLNLSEDKLAELANVCNNFPTIKIEYQLEKEVFVAGENGSVKLIISRPYENEVASVHAPYLSFKKEESWWIIIGEHSSNRLLSIKKIVIKDDTEFSLNFVVPESGNHKLSIFLISDSYLGADQEFEMDLKVNEALKE